MLYSMELEMDAFIHDLNDKQKTAVLTPNGPLMIIAGAGSGKTRVISLKIASLLQMGILPTEILALTFSNKAANEMEERITPYCTKKTPMISTFHAFGYYLISRFSSHLNIPKKFTIYDTNDQIQVVTELLKNNSYNGLQSNNNDEVSPFTQQQHISALKNKLLDASLQSSALETLTKDYDAVLRAYHALDFDDLILMPIALLQIDEVKDKLKNQFKYILIDEFQDTSMLQFEIIKHLAEHNRNVCVVGDDDQSIYSWRGADLKNWNRFTNTFPEYKEIILDTSYRCSSTILKAANAVIAKTPRMREKNLISLQTDSTNDSPIYIIALPDEQQEVEYIIDMASLYHYQHSIPWSEIGILSRTNNLFHLFEASLGVSQIPYAVSGGSSFFDHAEVRDLMAYLRLVNNQNDDVSCRRIINTPRRGIGITSLEALTQHANKMHCSLFEACILAGAGEIVLGGNATQTNCYDFTQFIREINQKLTKGIALSDCLKDIVAYTHYKEYLVLTYAKKQKLLEWKESNVDRLIEIILNFDLKGIPPQETVNILSYKMSLDKQDQEDTLSLMTIHAAKGLEKTVIFVAGMEQGILPHKRSIEENPEQIHEETRLCYVAITRAKKHLHLTWAQTRKNKRTQQQQAIPSQYLNDIPKDIITNDIPQERNEKVIGAFDDFLKNI